MPVFQRSVGGLFLVCLFLSGLYAIGVLSRSIWFDEAITLQSLSDTPFSGVESGRIVLAELQRFVQGTTDIPSLLAHYRDADVHPPLYFLIAHFATLIFGNSLFVVRGTSLVLVIGSVFLLGRWLLRSGHAAPWSFLLVYGLSFAALTTAQDARGYALALLLGVGAWILLARLPDMQGRQRVFGEIGLGLLCGGLLLTHYFAALLVSGFYVWHLGQSLMQKRAIALLSPCVAIAVFAIWVPIFLDHLTARPNQMTGFLGLADWIKRAAILAGGQVFSATSPDVPNGLQKLGRLAALGLMVIGAVAIPFSNKGSDTVQRFGRIAVVVPVVGLSGFLCASIVMDRWFAVMRYFLFFAPFLAYLAAFGAWTLGRPLARFAMRDLGGIPLALVIIGQAAMVNFGWEVNANRGGAYYKTIATQIQDDGQADAYLIVDQGSGRGTPLAVAYALPSETPAYLLSQDPGAWAKDAQEITDDLAKVQEVYLIFTIERGSMESDKTLLYGPIIDAIVAAGFVREAALPRNRGDRFYAKWIREG